MPKFSERSNAKLETCHQDLQILFSHVIKDFDCTVTHGQRTPEYQFSLYKQGRKEINGVWEIDNRKEVVTNCDGINIKSRHNITPLSGAVDVVPYPTLYSDIDTIRHFAGFVLGVAKTLKRFGTIDSDIICGIDWDGDNDLHDQKLFDACHFQIK